MLLPEIKLLVSFCGGRSIGEFLLGPECRAVGGNGAEHRILRDLLQGKPISRKRLQKLAEKILAHTKTLMELPSDFKLPVIPDEVTEQHNAPYLASLDFWDAICRSSPADQKWSTVALRRLINASLTLHRTFEKEGPPGLVRELRLIESGHLGLFLTSLADKIESSDTHIDSSVATLQVFGIISLINIFLVEKYEKDPERLRGAMDDLYYANEGVTRPCMSFAGWMRRVMDEGGYKKQADMLRHLCGSDEHAIRDCKRFLSGEIIPPYQRSLTILQKLNLSKSTKELHQRALGLFLITLIAKSAKHLAIFSDIQSSNLPHAVGYDVILAHLDERARVSKFHSS